MIEEQIEKEIKGFCHEFLYYALNRIYEGNPKERLKWALFRLVGKDFPEIYIVEPISHEEYAKKGKEIDNSSLNKKEKEDLEEKLHKSFIDENNDGACVNISKSKKSFLIFNKNNINKKGINYTNIAHEASHYLRNLVEPRTEKGLKNIYNDYYYLMNRIQNKGGMIPADITEFFAILSNIILHDFIITNKKYSFMQEEINKRCKVIKMSSNERYGKCLECLSEYPPVKIDEYIHEFWDFVESINNYLVRMSTNEEEIEKLKNKRDYLKNNINNIGESLFVFANRNNLNLELNDYLEDFWNIAWGGIKKIFESIIKKEEPKNLIDRFNLVYDSFKEKKFPWKIMAEIDLIYMKQLDEKNKDMYDPNSYSNIEPYLRAHIAIANHFEEISANWPQIFKMPWQEVEAKYFSNIERPEEILLKD